jgi:transcription elongation factor Elf1
MPTAGYRRLVRERNKLDRKQQLFNAEGVAKRKEPPKVEVTTVLDIKQAVMCPFCLYENHLQVFLVSTKKGISQSKAKCPECKNGMLMRSLTADLTVEEYAEWCFGYVADGFWKKVPFERWKSRLFHLGWSQRFWERYKQLKGDSGIESYEEHIMQQQQEAHEHEEDDWQ